MSKVYADIIVDISQEKLDKSFQYEIPENLQEQVEIGKKVLVSFGNGNRKISGYVIGISDTPKLSPEKIKPVLEVVTQGIEIESHLIALAGWIAKNYGSTVNQALKTVLLVKEKASAKEKKYIDECGAANFFGIKDNTYITPKSSSILPSITNKSLMQLAEDMGIKVERRPIPEEELETFEEAGACGTAAVISPIQRIDDLENGKSYVISKDGKPGPICTKLYNKLRGIQYGDEPDTHGWVTIVE